MTDPEITHAEGYQTFYDDFDSPLMRRFRREAYGEDIGQHSWVSADDLRRDVARLGLSASSRLVDLGCGPGGPLAFILSTFGCAGTGLDLSPEAVRAARTRADALGVGHRFTTQAADLNERLPFDDASFDAAISLDVVLHIRDRARFFLDVARLLRPVGRFLFTDGGVVTGELSSDEVRARSIHGVTQFVVPGVNERLLAAAGFGSIEAVDTTDRVIRNATGRLAALRTLGAELEQVWGAAGVAEQVRYLDTVLDLSHRRALSRIMYFATRQESP